MHRVPSHSVPSVLLYSLSSFVLFAMLVSYSLPFGVYLHFTEIPTHNPFEENMFLQTQVFDKFRLRENMV